MNSPQGVSDVKGFSGRGRGRGRGGEGKRGEGTIHGHTHGVPERGLFTGKAYPWDFMIILLLSLLLSLLLWLSLYH